MKKQAKGMIALDIDGTITIEKHHLDQKVSNFLNQLISEGWQIAFVTGRTFSFALPILSKIEGPFHLAVQNGAALYTMPSKELIFKHFIETDALPALNEIFAHEVGGLLVESGQQNRDICYYRPSDFTKEELEYIHFRIGISPEHWEAVASFNDVPFKAFSVGKFFATEEKAHELAERIRKIPGANYNVVVISDPFKSHGFLAHINQERASKGRVFDHLGKPAIAAGDDYNDVEMLEKADIKIVMPDAPAPLQERADIIAPPAKDHGIIAALREAMQRWME